MSRNSLICNFLIKQINAFFLDQVTNLLFSDFENIYSPIICVAIPSNLDTFKVLFLNVSYYFEYFGTKNLYIHRKIPFDLKARFEYSMLVKKKPVEIYGSFVTKQFVMRLKVADIYLIFLYILHFTLKVWRNG